MPLGGDAAVKNLSRWNPYRYINVWLVNNCVIAMGAGAYAYFPWNAFGLEDGIVITASSMGAAFPYFLLSHEVGHYFGLYHNNEGDSCLNDNCLMMEIEFVIHHQNLNQHFVMEIRVVQIWMTPLALTLLQWI
jgi:hypothetical protein